MSKEYVMIQGSHAPHAQKNLARNQDAASAKLEEDLGWRFRLQPKPYRFKPCVKRPNQTAVSLGGHTQKRRPIPVIDVEV
jgi:hypothetical protein